MTSDSEAPSREIVDLSEEAIAQRFISQFRSELKYTASTGQWHRWTGGYWKIDSTQYAMYEMATFLRRFANERALAVEAALKVADMNVADVRSRALRKVERFKTNTFRNSLLARVAIDPSIAVEADAWDGPGLEMLLNTPDGTIDLTTGHLRKAKPSDFITKMTAIGPRVMETPRWTEFLARITANSKPLMEYLQRVFGYCLTGHTTAHAFFFAFGTGANGKSALMSTIEGIMKDYHRRSRVEVFVSSSHDLHPAYIASLQGARFITATEIEEGRRWNQARLQEMTGGDMIQAHYMHRDPFSFTPQFKVMIAGNHKPSIESVGEAIRRRLHYIPFSVTIPEAERDPDLVVKLQAEWPGILQWAVEGCLQWQKYGLQPPLFVRAATNQYLVDEDDLAEWFADCCVKSDKSWEPISDLYRNWTSWARRRDISSISCKRFSMKLDERADVLGLKRQRRGNGAGFYGVAIAPASHPQKSNGQSPTSISVDN